MEGGFWVMRERGDKGGKGGRQGREGEKIGKSCLPGEVWLWL